MKKIFSVILSSLTILTCLSGCGNSLKNVIFNNTVVTYDGKMHSIEASNLPSGVSVRYENNYTYRVKCFWQRYVIKECA